MDNVASQRVTGVDNVDTPSHFNRKNFIYNRMTLWNNWSPFGEQLGNLCIFVFRNF